MPHQQRVDLIIVTPHEFMNAVKPLKDHKEYTGLPTEILTLEDIYKTYPGRDEAERIKRCLVDYHHRFRLQFALLVGDGNKFPMRYTKTDRKTAAAKDIAFCPADLYYADLYNADGSFADWDVNKNGYFGELHGESHTGPINIDSVDLQPDIAVGRIPASTVNEVELYVAKVISYEFKVHNSQWAKSVLLTASTDWVADYCKDQEYIAQHYLGKYTVKKLYAAGNPCLQTPDLNAANIIDAMNSGLGWISYMGHGRSDAWVSGISVSDLNKLTNADRLPIMFAVACSTSEFATLPPYHPYTDVNGQSHAGTDFGEVFQTAPPQPACIQTVHNTDGFGETAITKSKVGTIAYVGCVTGAQPFGRELNKFFFEALSYGHRTVGSLWNYMVRRYYEVHVNQVVTGNPDWTKVAEYHQPWKFFLFGDPSLRVGGVSPFQQADFSGTYDMFHDGWRGELRLWARDGDIIEGVPNMAGEYTDQQGKKHTVRGYVRTWTYPLSKDWGPDHQIIFYINFPDTASPGDDQKFQGYLFTQTKNAIAGTTWWNNIPFGFYAVKRP